MKIKITVILFFLSVSALSSKSRNGIDSIKNLLLFSLKNGQNADTTTINQLNKLAEDLFNYNTDSSLYYAQKSVFLSRKINYKKGLAYGLLQSGHVNYFKGNLRNAENNFDAAIPIFKQLNDKIGLGKCYLFYGRLYSLYGDHNLAKAYFNESLILNKEVADEVEIADCYRNLGNSYYSEGKLSTALEFYYKALILAIKHHNNPATADDYNDIGNVLQDMEMYPSALDYFKKALGIYRVNGNQVGLEIVQENIGEIIYTQNNYDPAIIYLTKSLESAKKQDDKEGICLVYSDLGLCFEKKNQHTEAINYLEKSLQIAVEFKIGSCEANTCANLAVVYNLQGKYSMALKYAVRSQKLALKLGNLKVRTNAVQQLNIALAALGQFQGAYQMLLLYNNLKDSLYNNESIQKLTSYNLALDFDAKQKQLALQQHEKDELYKQRIEQQRFVISIALLIILGTITISVVYYRQKRKQQRVNSMLEEKNREVSEQKTNLDDQAQKLNDLNTLKDRLISVLAHDLRAPLSTLRGLFTLLQDETISHEQMLEMIPGVLKKLEYTSDFLDTLLFWINSQMENFESSVKNFNVKNISAYEVENYEEQAASKGIKLIDSVPDDLVASADPNSVRIVIRNLITNAIKFSRENDVIEIDAARYNGKYQIITVSDTGTGMTEEQADKLFKSKVNSKTGTNNETGTGMGLLFCKDLVEKCNGKIWVTSKQGSGTKFSFTLPVGILNENPADLVNQ